MMNYLLDTCVLSEFTRREPTKQVIHWINSLEEDKLFICVITIGEIQRGVERLSDSHRKTDLLSWMNNDLITRFSSRIVGIDTQTMLQWGSLTARLESIGRPISIMDSLIAACALQNNFVLATRNTVDFEPTGVQIINPWM